MPKLETFNRSHWWFFWPWLPVTFTFSYTTLVILVPEEDVKEVNIPPGKRWLLISQLTQHIWSRWSSEYLTSLQSRQKWRLQHRPVAVSDLVLIRCELTPPAKWPIARITAIHPGSDGITRVVDLRTAATTLRRPIAKIVRLHPAAWGPFASLAKAGGMFGIQRSAAPAWARITSSQPEPAGARSTCRHELSARARNTSSHELAARASSSPASTSSQHEPARAAPQASSSTEQARPTLRSPCAALRPSLSPQDDRWRPCRIERKFSPVHARRQREQQPCCTPRGTTALLIKPQFAPHGSLLIYWPA